jgi:anhydro-N-acetylmuramic acid kinase
LTVEQKTESASLFVGLISGTSMDGVDAALAAITEDGLQTLATSTYPYPTTLRDKLAWITESSCRITVDEFCALDVELAEHFSSSALQLLQKAQIPNEKILAIGSHGQTIRHRPRGRPRYSLQLGQPSHIAAITQIRTVADFRSMLVALGDEGAPLVPPFHQWLFGRNGGQGLILNIGGISNVTVLAGASGNRNFGFDLGPGNCLLDILTERCLSLPLVENGAWGRGGKASQTLLDSMLSEPYFSHPYPKSTGRELFNLEWLAARIEGLELPAPLSANDIQATLYQLTVESTARQIESLAVPPDLPVYVCGGGARNSYLMECLTARLPKRRVSTTSELGVDPDFVEALAFAWLARQRFLGIPIEFPEHRQVRRLVLGGLFEPRLHAE